MVTQDILFASSVPPGGTFAANSEPGGPSCIDRTKPPESLVSLHMRPLFAVALALLFLASCARPAVPTDTLIIDQQREPMSLNAALENGASSTELGLLLFNYLVKFNDRGQLVGDVATAVPTLANGGISSDGKTITYHLRAGVRFADGTPLTARDCVYSIDAILNPANNVQSRYGYDRIARADAPNATTLVLHLREPFAPLITLVLAPQGYPILPAHLLASKPNFNHIAFDDAPIGGGPYVVAHWYHGDRLELTANPHYFRGAPSIKHVTIRFVSDSSTAVNQLHTGEASGLFNDLDMSNVPLIAAIPQMRLLRTPVNAVGSLIYNTQDPITGDPRVRRALTQAIDIPSLIAKAYRGAVDATAAGRGLFEWAYDPRAPLTAPYDPAAARALMRSAGWRTGSGGIRTKNGKRLTVLMLIQANTPGDEIIGSAIQQAERAIGVDLSLKAYEVTQFAAPAQSGGPIYGGKFQMALYPFVNGDDPDVTDQFGCANIPPNGYNKPRYCDPALDALMKAARTTYDPARRLALYARIQERLSRALPMVLLYQRREVDAFSNRIHGPSGSVSSVLWDAGSWTMSP